MITRILYFGVSSLLLIAGAAFLSMGGWIEYSDVKAYLDQFSYQGGVSFFTLEYFQGVIERVRMAGAAFCFMGIVLLVMARRWIKYVDGFFSGLGEDARALWRWIREYQEKPSWVVRSLFWLILIGGIGIRLYFIDQPVRADEACTFNSYVFRPYIIMLSDWTAPNNHIFHSAVVRLVYLLSGSDNEVLLRLPVFVFGILLMPLIFVFGRKYYDVFTGLLLMLYVAFALPMVSYSTMARGYSPLFVFSYILFLTGLYLRENPGNRAAWVVCFVASSLGFHTIPSMLYSFAGFGLWMAFTPSASGRSELFNWWGRLLGFAFLTVIAVAIIYLPVLVATDWSEINDDSTLVGGQSWAQRQIELVKMLPLFWNALAGQLNLFVLILLGIGIAGYFLRIHHDIKKPPLWLFALLVSFVFPVFIQRTVPYDRIYHVFFPLLFSVPLAGLAYLIQQFSARQARVVLALVCLSSMAAAGTQFRANFPMRYITTGDHFTSAEPSVLFLKSRVAPDDVVIAWSPSPGPMVFYAKRYGFEPRIWDLLQFIPTLVEGTNKTWIVVNAEHPRDLSHYLERLNRSDLIQICHLMYDDNRCFIYQIDGVGMNGFSQTGE